jgi:hypothetical protein
MPRDNKANLSETAFSSLLFARKQADNQRNDVRLPVGFPGGFDPPVTAPALTVEQLVDVLNHRGDTDDRVAAENVRQAVGQAAGQAFARAFLQLELEMQLIVLHPGVMEGDIIGSLVTIPQQRLKKLVGPIWWKKHRQLFSRENRGKTIRAHTAYPPIDKTPPWGRDNIQQSPRFFLIALTHDLVDGKPAATTTFQGAGRG